MRKTNIFKSLVILLALVLTVNCDPSQHGSGSEEDACWDGVMISLMFATQDCKQPIPKEKELGCLLAIRAYLGQSESCREDY